jgi:predicted nucleotidyltransferase
MADIHEILQEKREEILRTATKYGARNVRLFGSAARGETTEHSDIDMLVEMDPHRSLLDLSGLRADMEALLGRKVDIVRKILSTGSCVAASSKRRRRYEQRRARVSGADP